ERLLTYMTLEWAAARLRPDWRKYNAILRNRPPTLIRALLTIADARFLLRQAGGLLQPDVAEALPELAVVPNHVAEWGSIVSVALADALRLSPLSQAEINAEPWQGLQMPELILVLELAALRSVLHAWQKLVVLFGYSLEEIGSSGKRRVICLKARSTDFEKGYRAGLIREVLHRDARLTRLPLGEKVTSMMELGRLVARGAGAYSIREV